jgi:hypothetical protein
VALNLWLVLRYAVDVPFWDEWALGDLLIAYRDLPTFLTGLTAQHNEHRMVVPRAIQVLAALIDGRWDTRVGMWISQCLLILTLAACVVLWRRSLSDRTSPLALVALGLVALVLFSPAQHQNLLWGFQLCFFIPAACLLVSLVVSSPGRPVGAALAAAAVSSTIATFTIVPGFLTWPLSAWAIVIGRTPCRVAWVQWSGFGVCSALVALAYFSGYDIPSRTPPVVPQLTAPTTLLQLAAACLGGFFAIGTDPVRTATVAGAFIMALFGWSVTTVWRHRTDPTLVRACAPWLVIGAFGLTTALAISLGRGGYGPVAMLESRYTTVTGWTLVSIVMLSTILWERLATTQAALRWVCAVLAIGVASGLSIPHHVSAIRRSHVERLQSLAVYQFAEIATRGEPMLPPWMTWPHYREQLITLEEQGWRRRRPSTPAWLVDDGCEFGATEFGTAAGPRLFAGGWAYIPGRGQPAHAVLVTFTANGSRHIDAITYPDTGRARVGRAPAAGLGLVSGWTVEARAPRADETEEFWALDVESLEAVRLCSDGR